MKKYEYTGGNLKAIDCTLGKVYDSFIDSDGYFNIVDDFYLEAGYDVELMIKLKLPCVVTSVELLNSFKEVN